MSDKTAKYLALLLLILLSAVILGWGIWQYRLFYEWLEPRHIEGLVLMTLLAFGLTAVFIPFLVRQEWRDSSAKDVFIHYGAAFGLMFVALTAVFFLLWLLGHVYRWLQLYPIIVFILAAIILMKPLLRRLQKYLSKGER